MGAAAASPRPGAAGRARGREQLAQQGAHACTRPGHAVMAGLLASPAFAGPPTTPTPLHPSGLVKSLMESGIPPWFDHFACLRCVGNISVKIYYDLHY